jgi:hypothetical protein
MTNLRPKFNFKKPFQCISSYTEFQKIRTTHELTEYQITPYEHEDKEEMANILLLPPTFITEPVVEPKRLKVIPSNYHRYLYPLHEKEPGYELTQDDFYFILFHKDKVNTPEAMILDEELLQSAIIFLEKLDKKVPRAKAFRKWFTMKMKSERNLRLDAKKE